LEEEYKGLAECRKDGDVLLVVQEVVRRGIRCMRKKDGEGFERRTVRAMKGAGWSEGRRGEEALRRRERLGGRGQAGVRGCGEEIR